MQWHRWYWEFAPLFLAASSSAWYAVSLVWYWQKKGLTTYNANPEQYGGYGMLNAGKIMSIIGIVFGAIYTLYYIIFVCIIGAAGASWLGIFGDLLS